MKNLVTRPDQIEPVREAPLGNSETVDERADNIHESAGQPRHAVLRGEVEALVRPFVDFNKNEGKAG